MAELKKTSRLFDAALLGVLIAIVGLFAASGSVVCGQQKNVDVLKIGSSGTLTSETGDKKKEEGALETLRSFIKEETGLNNEIARQKDWNELAQKMSKGELHLGVYQGYEFAWAQERYPELRPLAIAVNVYRYPVAYIVVNNDKGPKDFAGLQGRSLAIPGAGQQYLRMYIEHMSQANGKTLETFFSKITSQAEVEDALDDAVDSTVDAVVADRAALEAFKRRKPARFKQLKDIAHSQPLPPAVVAYYEKVLPEETLKKFREGILNASHKEKGQTILTLFHLTAFEPIPEDFDKVLADTRKTYPPPTMK